MTPCQQPLTAFRGGCVVAQEAAHHDPVQRDGSRDVASRSDGVYDAADIAARHAAAVPSRSPVVSQRAARHPHTRHNLRHNAAAIPAEACSNHTYDLLAAHARVPKAITQGPRCMLKSCCMQPRTHAPCSGDVSIQGAATHHLQRRQARQAVQQAAATRGAIAAGGAAPSHRQVGECIGCVHCRDSRSGGHRSWEQCVGSWSRKFPGRAQLGCCR